MNRHSYGLLPIPSESNALNPWLSVRRLFRLLEVSDVQWMESQRFMALLSRFTLSPSA